MVGCGAGFAVGEAAGTFVGVTDGDDVTLTPA